MFLLIARGLDLITFEGPFQSAIHWFMFSSMKYKHHPLLQLNWGQPLGMTRPFLQTHRRGFLWWMRPRKKNAEKQEGTAWSREAVGSSEGGAGLAVQGRGGESRERSGGGVGKSSLPLWLVSPRQSKEVSWASALRYAQQMVCQTYCCSDLPDIPPLRLLAVGQVLIRLDIQLLRSRRNPCSQIQPRHFIKWPKLSRLLLLMLRHLKTLVSWQNIS